jgi:hypothetical protein
MSQHYAARNALATTTSTSTTASTKDEEEEGGVDEGAVDAVVRGRKVSAGRELDSTDGKRKRCWKGVEE